MKIDSVIRVKGKVQIYNTKGELLTEADNLEVDTGLNIIVNLLNNNPAFTGLNYFAFGTGATAPTSGDTSLGAETFRDVFTNSDTGTNTFIATLFVLASNCSIHIKEAGLFGNGATAVANSGTLFSRALIDYDNSALQNDLVFSWTATFTAV